MRRPEPEAVAITADRTKAMAVALAGLPDDAAVELAGLELPHPRRWQPCSASTRSTSGA